MPSLLLKQKYEYGALVIVIIFLATCPVSLGYTLTPNTYSLLPHTHKRFPFLQSSSEMCSQSKLKPRLVDPLCPSMVASKAGSRAATDVAEQLSESKSYWRIRRVKGLHLAAEKGYVDLTYIDIREEEKSSIVL
eukprot:763522-Hanusia_phi.AAC.4